jgi:hypothetical protein
MEPSRAFLVPYLVMIEDFLADRMTDVELQRIYQGHAVDDHVPMDPQGPEYHAINEFFLDLEDYVEDPSLRRPEDFDEAELRRRAQRARGEIRALLAETGELPAP